jgi:peptide/nickel transport system substrate-binding protein
VGNSNYQKAATVYSYDPDKAKSLLSAAGVSNLSFELVTTNTAFISDSAPVLIDSWKKIGVNATLNTKPSSAVYGNIVPASSFRVLAASGDPSVFGVDADLLLRWYYYGKTWVTDRMRWSGDSTDKVTSLIDKAAQQSGSEQAATWKQVFDIIAEEVPLYPVYHTKMVTGSDPSKLTDFKGAATTGLYFLGVGRKG